MSAASKTSPQPMLLDLDSDTSSPASADGVPHSDSLASPTMPTFGPGLVRVSHSGKRARGAERATLDIFGRHGSHSSSSVALQSSLESRLRAEMASSGSTLFSLTWSDAVTPSGRRICALRASVLRTSGSGSTSWPTPTRQDAAISGSAGYAKTATHNPGVTLTDAARMATWPTPQSRDGSHGGGQAARAMGETRHGSNLDDFALLASWVTPAARDHKDTPGMATTGPDGRSRLDQLPRQAQLAASGLPQTGSPASTATRGQLSPAHSRWLMGYPHAWDDCAVTATPSSRKSRRHS